MKPLKIVVWVSVSLMAILAIVGAGAYTPKLLQMNQAHSELMEYRAEVISEIEAGNVEYIRHIKPTFIYDTEVGISYISSGLGALGPNFLRSYLSELLFGKPVEYKIRIDLLRDHWAPVLEAAQASDHPLFVAATAELLPRKRQLVLYHHYHDVLDQALQDEDYELAYFTAYGLEVIRNKMFFDDNAFDEPVLSMTRVDRDFFETIDERFYRMTLLAHLSGADHFTYNATRGERAYRRNVGGYAEFYLNPRRRRGPGHTPEQEARVRALLERWEASHAD